MMGIQKKSDLIEVSFYMIKKYSHYFNNRLELFLTKSEDYWDKNSKSRKDRILSYVNYEKTNLIMPHQVHGDKVVVIAEDSKDIECDGIIYNGKSDLVGAINVADCIPVCVYDYNNNYIALIHSGWRGTIKKIVIKTVYKMLKLGAKKNSLGVFIGPSIRGCCYQVENFFASKFDDSCVIEKDGVFFVDLASQLLQDLKDESILRKNIFIDESCTFESPSLHSYRRDKSKSGRMSLVAYMK